MRAIYKRKGKREFLGVLKSQAAALPRRDQEEEETDKPKQVQIKQTYGNTKIIFLPQVR